MGQFDVNYRPRTAIKGQAIADFIATFTYSDTIEVAITTYNVEAAKGVETEKGRMSMTRSEDNSNDVKQWTLFMDGTSNENE